MGIKVKLKSGIIFTPIEINICENMVEVVWWDNQWTRDVPPNKRYDSAYIPYIEGYGEIDRFILE